MEPNEKTEQIGQIRGGPNNPDPSDEINLLEYLLIIAEHKKLISLSTVIAFVLACGMTLMMTNVYTATARILPPQQEQPSLSSMLGGVNELASLAGFPLGSGSGDLYIGILKSRTVADAIIDRFELMDLYGEKTRIQTYEKLNRYVNVSLGKKDGIIAVSVDDKDPQRAADIANAYVEELKKLNVQFNLNNAGKERQFLENRIGVVKVDLQKAEDELQNFQKQNKAIRIDDQATAIIQAIAQLKGDLAVKEIELGVLLSSQTEQNPQVKTVRQAIAELKDQLLKLERSPVGQKVSDDIFIATSDVPELGIRYARLMRNFKIQETLFELLTKQYEVSKINEARNTSKIQVLDQALPPDKKSKPKRSIIVLMVTFVTFLSTLFYSFIRNYGQQMNDKDKLLWLKIKQSISFSPRRQ